MRARYVDCNLTVFWTSLITKQWRGAARNRRISGKVTKRLRAYQRGQRIYATSVTEPRHRERRGSRDRSIGTDRWPGQCPDHLPLRRRHGGRQGEVKRQAALFLSPRKRPRVLCDRPLCRRSNAVPENIDKASSKRQSCPPCTKKSRQRPSRPRRWSTR